MPTNTIRVGQSQNASATKLVSAGDGPTLVQNLDPNNTLYIGDSNGVAWNDPTTVSPLGPDGFVSVDGNADLYGVTQPPQVIKVAIIQGSIAAFLGSVNIASGSLTATISGPVEIEPTAGQPLDVSAATVNITPSSGSVFPPGKIGNLFTLSSPQTLTGVGVTPGIINVQDYTAIDFGVSAHCTTQGTAGAPLTAWIQAQWYDDSGGTRSVYLEDWFFWVSTTAALFSLAVGTLPVRGQYLQLRILNNPAATINATLDNFWITGTYRSIEKSKVRQGVPNSLACSGATRSSFVGNSGNLQTNNLGTLNTVTPGTGLQFYPMPLFDGPVYLLYTVNTAALVNNPTIADMSGVISGGIVAGTSQANFIWVGPNTTAQTFQEVIIFPRSPCALIVNPAATSTIQFAAMGQEV